MDKVIELYKKGFRMTTDGCMINPKGNEISGWISRGYKNTTLRDGKRCLNVAFHRLQAFQKYGMKIFEKGIVVRHFNGIRSDNSYDNILIGTFKDNSLDMPKEIRITLAIYAASFLIKHHNREEIKLFYNSGHTVRETMKEFNVSSTGTMHYILKH